MCFVVQRSVIVPGKEEGAWGDLTRATSTLMTHIVDIAILKRILSLLTRISLENMSQQRFISRKILYMRRDEAL